MSDDGGNPIHPVVIGPEEGERLRAGGNQITLKVTSEHSRRLTLLEFSVAPNFAAPPLLHHHTREDWVAYVIEGEVIFVFSDREVRAPTGTTVLIPAGADFAWRNDADEPARYLAIHAPAGFDQFFVDVAEQLSARAGPPTPEVMQQVIPPLWAKYGIESESAGKPS